MLNVLPLDTFKLISNAHNSSVCSSPRVMFTRSFLRCRYTSPPYQFRIERTLNTQYANRTTTKQRSRDDKQIPLYCYKREDNRSTITFVLDVCHVLAIIQGEIPILYFDAIFFPVNLYSKTVGIMCIVVTQSCSLLQLKTPFGFIHRSRFFQSSEDLL